LLRSPDAQTRERLSDGHAPSIEGAALVWRHRMFVVDKGLNYGRHLIGQFLQQAGPCSIVLDVGAGGGADLQIARERCPGAALKAVEAYAENQQRLREAGVEVHDTDIERQPLPFEDESVDVVIANQILEHCKELFWILHNVSRVLKRGGWLIVGVPNLASLHNRLLLAVGRQPTVINNSSAHVRGFTRSDLLGLLESGFPGGYRLADYGGSNFYPFSPLIARPLARIMPSMAWGLFLLLEKQLPYARSYLDYLEDHEIETNFFKGND